MKAIAQSILHVAALAGAGIFAAIGLAAIGLCLLTAYIIDGSTKP